MHLHRWGFLSGYFFSGENCDYAQGGRGDWEV